MYVCVFVPALRAYGGRRAVSKTKKMLGFDDSIRFFSVKNSGAKKSSSLIEAIEKEGEIEIKASHIRPKMVYTPGYAT